MGEQVPPPEVRKAYEEVLTEWAEAGFTGPYHSGRRAVPSVVEWDAAGGCYRVRFQIGGDCFDMSEAEFEVFVLGVSSAALFLARGRSFPGVRVFRRS